MGADGSSFVQLTQSGDISAFGIDWSPDGSRLVLVSNRDGDDDIYVMSVPRAAAPQQAGEVARFGSDATLSVLRRR